MYRRPTRDSKYANLFLSLQQAQNFAWELEKTEIAISTHSAMLPLYTKHPECGRPISESIRFFRILWIFLFLRKSIFGLRLNAANYFPFRFLCSVSYRNASINKRNSVPRLCFSISNLGTKDLQIYVCFSGFTSHNSFVCKFVKCQCRHSPKDSGSIFKIWRSPRASIVFADDFIFVTIHVVCAGPIFVNRCFPTRWIVVGSFCGICAVLTMLLLLLLLLLCYNWLTVIIVHQYGGCVHNFFVGHPFLLQWFLIVIVYDKIGWKKQLEKKLVKKSSQCLIGLESNLTNATTLAHFSKYVYKEQAPAGHAKFSKTWTSKKKLFTFLNTIKFPSLKCNKSCRWNCESKKKKKKLWRNNKNGMKCHPNYERGLFCDFAVQAEWEKQGSN